MLRKEGSLFTAPVAGLIGDDSEWADCDDALDIKWGLVGVDIGIEPDSGCSECEEFEFSCLVVIGRVMICWWCLVVMLVSAWQLVV